MRRVRSCATAMAAMFLLAGVLPVRAAEGDGERPGRRRGGDRAEREARREEVRGRIKMLRMWRLTETLSLTAEESGRFFPLVDRIEEIRESGRRDQEEKMRRLEDLLERRDAAAIGSLLDEHARGAEERGKREREALEEIRALLGTERTAKYLVANAKFEREIREMVSQRMRGGPGGPGRPGGAGQEMGMDGPQDTSY